ncbi:MAG TPA: hypothetical protein VL443_15440 [Cyclobacteriaceae bacterium]|nr:hypothetical protein [Cyclobacteriaceae bacterium]
MLVQRLSPIVTKQAKAHGVLPFWWDTGGALDKAKKLYSEGSAYN